MIQKSLRIHMSLFKNIHKLFWGVLLITVLASCDYFLHVSGVLTKTGTSLPLANVKVYDGNRRYRYTYSDSTGYFELNIVPGGFRCKPIDLQIDRVE